jgi:hypothetical protein
MNTFEDRLRQAKVYAAQVRARKAMGRKWLFHPEHV